MDRGLKEHCTNGNEMAFENSNKGLSFNNNLNSLYIKRTWNIYTHKKEKEKPAIIGLNALECFTCFFNNVVLFLNVILHQEVERTLQYTPTEIQVPVVWFQCPYSQPLCFYWLSEGQLVSKPTVNLANTAWAVNERRMGRKGEELSGFKRTTLNLPAV